MNELTMAYSRGTKGPIQLKQESEMLHLRKRVLELEMEKSSFEKKMAGLLKLIEELENRKHQSVPVCLPSLAEAESPPVVEPPGPKRIKIAEILQAVADHYEVTCSEILSSQRIMRIVHPRHVAMYLCCKYTLWSLPQIGRHMGDKDHTTVMHARDRITKLIGIDSGVARDVRDLEGQLRVGT